MITVVHSSGIFFGPFKKAISGSGVLCNQSVHDVVWHLLAPKNSAPCFFALLRAERIISRRFTPVDGET